MEVYGAGSRFDPGPRFLAFVDEVGPWLWVQSLYGPAWGAVGRYLAFLCRERSYLKYCANAPRQCIHSLNGRVGKWCKSEPNSNVGRNLEVSAKLLASLTTQSVKYKTISQKEMLREISSFSTVAPLGVRQWLGVWCVDDRRIQVNFSSPTWHLAGQLSDIECMAQNTERGLETSQYVRH
jgi:hypothetical protein